MKNIVWMCGMLIIKGTEKCGGSSNPVVFVSVSWQLDWHNKVCRVTGGRERSGARERFVNGTRVNARLLLLSVRHGNQVHCRHIRVELLWTRLRQLKIIFN